MGLGLLQSELSKQDTHVPAPVLHFRAPEHCPAPVQGPHVLVEVEQMGVGLLQCECSKQDTHFPFAMLHFKDPEHWLVAVQGTH